MLLSGFSAGWGFLHVVTCSGNNAVATVIRNIGESRSLYASMPWTLLLHGLELILNMHFSTWHVSVVLRLWIVFEADGGWFGGQS
jgi:hypothetical protein